MNPDDGAVTEAGRPSFKLRLLGFPAISATEGIPIAGLGPGKPLALLAFLAVRREARRDELVDLLWGEVNEANARNAFRQALHRLRTALGEHVIPQDRDRVELAGTDHIDVDRDAFLEAIDRGDIAAAVNAYRGDFLDGFELGEPAFDNWVDAERTRLKSRFQSALQNGAEAALSAGRWLEALQYVQRLTTLAPFEESAAILEANVLVAAGRTPEALEALRRFSQVLRDQLDLPPSPRVRELVSRIERADLSRAPTNTAEKPRETPFVGREAEIARLMTLVRGLSKESGETLFIAGPAGIGKSRLVSEFLARAKSTGPLLVLRGRERAAGTALSYASVAEALRGALRARGVAGTGRHLLSEASRILPELRDSFDLPEPSPIDAEGGRLRFFEGIAALLDAAAYEQPVCLVLDDVHLASTSTLDLVAYLTGRLHSSPVLMLLLLRDDVELTGPLDRLHRGETTDAEWADEQGTMRLSPLEYPIVVQLVERIVVARGVAGQVDVGRVAEAAAGNPLRAIELARRALNGEMPPATPIPLRDILWSRLQKASPSQRRVFFAAALLQRRCSLRLLAAAAHLPELATLEAAQELERLGLLAQESDAYVVAHDFTSTFVAEASGLAGRALLAGWAADALANEPVPPSADLANLYSVAGQQGAAFTHARRAVYDAATIGATHEVHRLLQLALALAPDARSREQAEAMLAAFGSGRKLLDAPAQTSHANATEAPPSVASPDSPMAAPPSKSHDEVATRRSRRPLLTPLLAALLIAGTIAISMAVVWAQSVSGTNSSRALRDTLMVVERGSELEPEALGFSGPLAEASEGSFTLVRGQDAPAWTQALQLPWIRPSISSAGIVAVERMTETGTDVYLMAGPGSTPVPVAVGAGTDAILGWAPDGGRLLVRRSRTLGDGAFDADLWVYAITGGQPSPGIPIDTSTGRSVEDEATWSPDGARIAWVALTGTAHQRDVFVARADGSNGVNVTDHAGEDYHISWSSDGNLLAFTSDRDGNPDLFAIEFEAGARRLWRLTNTTDEEDHASFSPDHRFVAYQSTAGGDAGVYVMPALGGLATRLTPTGGQFSIVGWRGRPPTGYVDRLRIIGPSGARIGDSVMISIFASDREANSSTPDAITIVVTDPASADIRPVPASNRYAIIPRRNGDVRVVASIPGWKYDTLTIQVGPVPSARISDDFSGGISEERWSLLGIPKPLVRSIGGAPSLYPNGDLQWQSGILSRSPVSLLDGTDVSATFVAPFEGRAVAGATLTLALVQDAARIDSTAPEISPLASVTWDGESSRFTYTVGPQSKSDPVSLIGPGSSHRVRIVVTPAGDLSFLVDDRVRWTSSLRFLGPGSERRARVWLGGKATGGWGAIQRLEVSRP